MRGHSVCDALDLLPEGMENILVLFIVSLLNMLMVKIEMFNAQKGLSVSRSVGRRFGKVTDSTRLC